jgi:exonuclease III
VTAVLLLSWNLAGRVKRLGEQAERLTALDADILCLQELTTATLPVWREQLAEAGYGCIEHPEPAAAGTRTRPLFVMTACREPLREVPVPDVPWPERVLAVRTGEGTEIVNVHSPISPKPDLAKVRTHRAVYEHLSRPAHEARILCGDLNTPRREHADGTVWTFARDQYGRLRADRGEQWDEAELLLIRGLEQHGFRDAFRTLHGYGEREISWGWRQWRGGYRLDHLIVAGLDVEECRYEHRWREDGLSDHSALVARLAPTSSP